jgi:predicted chitinase
MKSNPWAYFSPEQLAEAAQITNVENVRATWPAINDQLDLCGINRLDIQIGIIGTIATETASSFLPVEEGFYLGDTADAYRRSLKYWPYYGRGFVQLTHEANYTRYTKKLEDLWGVGSPNMHENPDALLDKDVSAAVISMWFRDERALPTPSWPQGYSLQNACDLHDDEWIRRLVYGGRDAVGEARINRVRQMLTGAKSSQLVYNPNQPPERQIQDWVCSIRATTWMLKSLGIDTDAGQMQDEMVPGVVTSALGLLDHRGYGISATVGRHLPSQTHIEVLETVTWEQLQDRAGRGPIALGSSDPRLYHWFNIAEAVPGTDILRSPNPSPLTPRGMGIGDEFSREEFNRYIGTWSAVFVEVIPNLQNPPDTTKRATDLSTLVGVAYHEDGTIIPALKMALLQQDLSHTRNEIQNVINFLAVTNPDR